jgi:hypothetical protein
MWLRRPALSRVLVAALLVTSTVSTVDNPVPVRAAPAAATVCDLYCDTRDPSLARQETFPVPERRQNNRRIVLHVSDVDGMAWGSIDDGTIGNSVWLDRSWDGGTTWEGRLGRASLPGTWTVWRATRDAAALATARRLADVVIASPTLVRDGILTEPCDNVASPGDRSAASADAAPCDDNQKQFKGVFLRCLSDLDRATGGAYRWFAVTQADAIWSTDRDPLNRLRQRWSGRNPAGRPNASDRRTQASAISALLAAA